MKQLSPGCHSGEAIRRSHDLAVVMKAHTVCTLDAKTNNGCVAAVCLNQHSVKEKVLVYCNKITEC